MRHLSRFNTHRANPKYNKPDRLEEFTKRANSIINYDEDDYEEGEEPMNVDILSELGDLYNEFDMNPDDLQKVIDSGVISDHQKMLEITLDNVKEFTEDTDDIIYIVIPKFSSGDINENDIKAFRDYKEADRYNNTLQNSSIIDCPIK